jgi:AHBA synthesis associated protein
VRAFAGIPHLLAELDRRGIVMGVVTGKHGHRARRILRRLELNLHFVVVIGGDEVRPGKPAPDVVWRALDVMKLDSGRAVLVGDSPLDVAAARAAGVESAGAMWGAVSRSKLNDARPDWILEAPADVLALVDSRARESASA